MIILSLPHIASTVRYCVHILPWASYLQFLLELERRADTAQVRAFLRERRALTLVFNTALALLWACSTRTLTSQIGKFDNRRHVTILFDQSIALGLRARKLQKKRMRTLDFRWSNACFCWLKLIFNSSSRNSTILDQIRSAEIVCLPGD